MSSYANLLQCRTLPELDRARCVCRWTLWAAFGQILEHHCRSWPRTMRHVRFTLVFFPYADTYIFHRLVLAAWTWFIMITIIPLTAAVVTIDNIRPEVGSQASAMLAMREHTDLEGGDGNEFVKGKLKVTGS